MVKIGSVDPLSLLEREDKWFLGGGKGAIYAPPFPRWLEKPGFWDECFYADIRLTHLYTVLFCDFGAQPVEMRGEVVSWRPDRLILEHRGGGRAIRETRLVTEQQEWCSVLELVSGEPVWAFVWAMPEVRTPGYGTPWQSLSSCAFHANSVNYKMSTAWPSEIEPDRTGIEAEELQSGSRAMLDDLEVVLELGANLPRISYTGNLAQRHDDSPLWQLSMLPQQLRNGTLPGDFNLAVGPTPIEGFFHILQQYELTRGEPLVVTCRASLTHNPRESSEFPGPEVIEANEQAWRSYFASVPQFSSSDAHLTAAYWYRWYGLRLNTVDIPALPLRNHASLCEPNETFSPFITEGVGFFRNFVTYSAQAHLREVAWMHSPRLGLGMLENLAKCQRKDGSFPGHNYSCRPPRDFYHADFATGASQFESLHGPVGHSFRSALKRYERWIFDNRLEDFRMVILDQNETGQEYMSRYLEASASADQWTQIRVAGVDATVYLMQLLRLLDKWFPKESIPSRIDQAGIYGLMFDWCSKGLSEMGVDNQVFFKDIVLGEQARKSGANPATGLYPLLLIGKSVGNIALDLWGNPWRKSMVLECTYQWLLNPNEFWLPKGFPATALSDPTFRADAQWKGKRLNCPWNGRSWPMVNSHMVDGIANVARMSPSTSDSDREHGELRRKAGEALMKAITLMFHNGDPARPNSYEHYDPFTGTPSLYRGYDDYMHSWIVDLIMRHAVGVQPGTDEVDPLPLGVDWIECTDIPHPQGRMSVRIEKDQLVRCQITSGISGEREQ